MMTLNFRLLHADEIEVRAGQKTKNGDKISLLLYKDARCDMALLDEVTGSPFSWQREHKEVKGVMYCGVSIWDDERGHWVTKWDAGKESNTEGEKGEASDSFKRACVNWGIGRELYTAPRIYVPVSTSTFDLKVSQIEYNKSREIVALTITDSHGNTVFSTGGAYKQKGNVTYAKQQEPTPAQAKPAIEPEVKLTPREQEECDAACADMDNATCRADIVATYNRYKDATFAPKLLVHGNKIIGERGW